MNCVSLATDGIVLWKLGRPCYTGTVRGHCPLSENWVSVHFCQGHCPVSRSCSRHRAGLCRERCYGHCRECPVQWPGLYCTVYSWDPRAPLLSSILSDGSAPVQFPANWPRALLLSSPLFERSAPVQQTARGIISCPALCSRAPLLSSILTNGFSPVWRPVRQLGSCPAACPKAPPLFTAPCPKHCPFSVLSRVLSSMQRPV